MTAEIAILDKSAVALAADSAVTIQVGSGQKICNTVNKLFTLSKYQPVGIMVYGNGEFMGVPWESIIKAHHRELAKTAHGTLREYVDRLHCLAVDREIIISGHAADAHRGLGCAELFDAA